jgi:hypothetical protein
LSLEGIVSQRVHGRQANATLKNWKPEMQQQIAHQFNARVLVEYLSLEDIFLELNA